LANPEIEKDNDPDGGDFGDEPSDRSSERALMGKIIL